MPEIKPEPLTIEIPVSRLNKWSEYLENIDPPRVDVKSNYEEMLQGALTKCMQIARLVSDDIELHLGAHSDGRNED